MCDPSAEDLAQQAVRDHGQFMARQERWTEQSNAMHAADRDRETTLGGMPPEDLLAFGARSDIVFALEHAPIDGPSSYAALRLTGITELERCARTMPTAR